jgi:hypothetical protein
MPDASRKTIRDARGADDRKRKTGEKRKSKSKSPHASTAYGAPALPWEGRSRKGTMYRAPTQKRRRPPWEGGRGEGATD